MANPSDVTPIDRYLTEQADLRVVERFARTDVSGRTGRWSELIPLSSPPAGEQYRFEVDLDRCSGCKACVTACHSLNGLDDGESFRAVGLIVAPAEQTQLAAAPPQQTVTTACHHCVDPGCLSGCPAEAYEKDPVTGIVKHLDDACIGCQYCTLTCPYDVPVYNNRLGIVRKCDMCSDRLAEGEAPACIQGCPTQAISITTVPTVPTVQLADEALAAASSVERLVPGAAPSHLTHPTTLYRGRSLSIDGSAAVDTGDVVPQHRHLPLVIMLVLSQWSVGVLAAVALFGSETERTVGLGVGAALGAVAALSSFTHLGQPLKAWRAVLGWRHSWLSREVIVLSLYIGLAAFAFLLSLTGIGGTRAVTTVAVVAAAVGVATVACSAMVYVATGRTWWDASQTSIRFGGTAVLAGQAWLAAGATWLGVAAAFALVATVGAKLNVESQALVSDDLDLRRTAALLTGPLAAQARLRRALGTLAATLIVCGAFVGAASESAGPVALVVVSVGSMVLVLAEMLERSMFFEACAPHTMPGAYR